MRTKLLLVGVVLLGSASASFGQITINERAVANEKTATASVTPETIVDEESVKNDPFYYGYFENKLKTAKTDLETLQSSKKTLNDDFEKLAELRKKIIAEEEKADKYKIIIKGLDSINYSNSKRDRWMPSAEEDQRDDFFNRLYSKDPETNNYLINNVSAQIGSNSAAISSELIASYFKAVRASFGTLMTNSTASEETPPAGPKVDDAEPDETNAFQRLLSSGGGNLYLNFELPLYYLQSSTFTYYFNTNARGGIALKQFSSDVDTATGSGNVGFNMYGSISSDDKKSFILFFNSNFGGYGGGTDFYNQLALTENKVFAFGQVTVGLDIAKSLRISYTVATFGSDESLRSERGVIGIQLLKGLFD